jgi:hypothetical protein
MALPFSFSVAYGPLALAATAIGTGVGVVGNIVAGQQAKQASEYEAQQAEMRANEARAAASRQAEQTRTKTELTQSRLKAVASQATGSATDAGVLSLGDSIERRGEYMALTDWAQGENRARGFEDNATAARFKGKQAVTGSYLKSAGTLFDGVGSFARQWTRTEDDRFRA